MSSIHLEFFYSDILVNKDGLLSINQNQNQNTIISNNNYSENYEYHLTFKSDNSSMTNFKKWMVMRLVIKNF